MQIIQDLLDEILEDMIPLPQVAWDKDKKTRNTKIQILQQSSLYKWIRYGWYKKAGAGEDYVSRTHIHNVPDGGLYSVRNHLDFLKARGDISLEEYGKFKMMMESDDLEMFKLAIRVLFQKKIEKMKNEA